MPSVIDHRPATLPAYIELVERLRQEAGSELWFRGAGQSAHKLLPTLYRHPALTAAFNTHELERSIFSRFRQRSLPFHSRDLKNDFDAMYFMQHYGVPTRLLDWSENPLTALHFALMTCPSKKEAGVVTYTAKPAVWVWNPTVWNRSILAHARYTGGPLSQTDTFASGYSSESGPIEAEHPMAMFGAHNSPRIVAQQGVFAIFGAGRVPMETLVRTGIVANNLLQRIIITEARVTKIRKSLLDNGVTESTIFPDLEGLARETKRYFGFES